MPRFCEAILLVVLVQPSSGASERCFSQLNFIRRVIGDKVLTDMFECRTMLRCNKNLGDDYEVD